MSSRASKSTVKAHERNVRRGDPVDIPYRDGSNNFSRVQEYQKQYVREHVRQQPKPKK